MYFLFSICEECVQLRIKLIKAEGTIERLNEKLTAAKAELRETHTKICTKDENTIMVKQKSQCIRMTNESVPFGLYSFSLRSLFKTCHLLELA